MVGRANTKRLHRKQNKYGLIDKTNTEQGLATTSKAMMQSDDSEYERLGEIVIGGANWRKRKTYQR